jgi:hypothetical protein
MVLMNLFRWTKVGNAFLEGRMRSACRMLVSPGLGYGLENRGILVRFPAEEKQFFLLQSVQIGSGNYPSFYSMGSERVFTRVKRPWREAELHLMPRLRISGSSDVVTFIAPREV